MRTFAWQDTLPVFSEREITSLSPYILQTGDEAFISFSRDPHSTNPYDLTWNVEEAHRFYTLDKALAVRSELAVRFDEITSILSL